MDDLKQRLTNEIKNRVALITGEDLDAYSVEFSEPSSLTIQFRIRPAPMSIARYFSVKISENQ
jgi:hypothetical protein